MITIGPTWMFSIPVCLMACLMLYIYVNGLFLLTNTKMFYKVIAGILIGTDLCCFLYTLLGN
jgi:hypothetical protein